MKAARTVLLPLLCVVALVAAACTASPTGGGGNIVPVAVARADSLSGQAPLLVRFSPAGSFDRDGFIESYRWDFGDGSPVSTAPNPSHTYTTGGSFSATLTVTDDGGASSSSAVVVVVTPPDNLPPVANITASTLSGKTPLSVSFSPTGSSDPDGTIVGYEWAFGDGDVATTSSTSHSYLVPGSYVVTLMVTDNNGAVNTDSTIVAVADNTAPTAHAVATPSSGKAPLAVSFDASTSTDDDGNVVAWSWDFTDGGTATGEVAVHTFAAVGTYNVKLTVTDDNGATDTTIVPVGVNPPQAPVAVANATPDGTKAPLGVLFSSAGSIDNDGAIIGYSWNFADGSPLSTSANPSHLYTAAGTYNVTLTVTDDDFLTTIATVPVIVGPPNAAPVAAGTATPAVGKPVLQVNFSSAASTDSDGTIVARSWNFGDGSPLSSAANPSHSYSTIGNYTALLTVTDDDGAINTAAVPVSVIPNSPPTAQPVATPRTGKEPMTVALSAATSGDSDGHIVSYAWDYTTDGSVDSTDVETSHVYSTPGTYTASLTVTDEDGATDTGTVTITVNANQPPTAVANSDFQSGNAPLSITFEGRDSLDAELDGTITYDWDFGDGSPHSTSATPTHVFQNIGSYTVTLTVTDDNGATGTDTLAINALDPVVRVRPTGSDVTGDGTAGAPYASIEGAITGAVAQQKTVVHVAGGTYGGFTAANGVSVIGGFDQSFVAGGGNGATAVTVSAGAGAAAVTASGLTEPLTLKNLTLNGGGGVDATAALVINSNVTFDGVTVDSGVASGAGSSAYGIRALDGAAVTVIHSTVRSRDGVAGAVGADGTVGTAGTTGAVGAQGNGTGGGVQNTASPLIRTGGGGANGVKCALAILVCLGASPGGGGGVGGDLSQSPNRGGAGGAGGGSGSPFDAGGGGAGTIAAAAAAGVAGTAVPGDTFSAGTGGSGGVALAGAGGGGGGSGGNNAGSGNSGGGGAGGSGGTSGTGGTGGRAGGGSFGVYGVDSSVTISDTTLNTGAGGTGGTGGKGGTGGAGGAGGAGANGGSSRGAGGGGGGGAGGNGGGGAAGGNGGPSIGAYHSGTGTLTAPTSSAGTIGNGGTSGAGGASGTAGNGGGGGAAGTGGTPRPGGGAGGAATSGAAGTAGPNGSSGLRKVTFDNGTPGNASPVAVAAVTPATGIAPHPVTFSSAGSFDPDGTITYSWNFGDGSPASTSANPSHTYATDGTFTATLTVTDNDGGTATATAVTTVAANQLPVGVANASLDAGKAPLGVIFSSAGSADGDGSIVGFSWNFGDGTPVSSSPDPSHTYSAQGNYTATLTVTDDKGGVGTATVTVSVSPNNVAPTVAITATPTFGKAPADVTFTSTVSDSDGTVDALLWNFGDGSPTSTLANPTHTYAAGVWTATLTATDNDGATTTKSVEIRSLPNLTPTAAAAATPSDGRAPLATVLSSAGSIDFDGTIASYHWNFGDGSPTSSAANPTHSYAAGTFTATLTVTDNEGASGTATTVIHSTVNQAPVAVANATLDGTKAPLGVNLSSAGSVDNDGTIATYRWDFGDGTPVSNAANPSHLYATAGTWSATLTVTDNEGATAIAAVSIQVGPPNVAPVVVASATPTNGRAPLPVTFTSAGSNDTDGTITTYHWDFGDGSPTVDTADTSHTYAPGTWTATLTLTDNDGATSSFPMTIHSTVNQAPVAVASGTPTSGVAPLTVALTSSLSSDTDGTIVSRVWDFGDGSPTDGAVSPSHTYAAGDYLATVTLTDNEGGTASASVLVHANAAPVAVATADVTSGDGPLTVHFTGSGSSDDGSIASYLWDFGDGSAVSSSANPSHTYSPGVHTATLTVTDNEGVTSTATVVIDVNDPPTASVTSNVTTGSAPLTVNFTGTAADSDGTFSFAWDFGDGGVNTLSLSPGHLYTNPGTYHVTLTVTDDRGSATVSSVRTITVT